MYTNQDLPHRKLYTGKSGESVVNIKLSLFTEFLNSVGYYEILEETFS